MLTFTDKNIKKILDKYQCGLLRCCLEEYEKMPDEYSSEYDFVFGLADELLRQFDSMNESTRHEDLLIAQRIKCMTKNFTQNNELEIEGIDTEQAKIILDDFKTLKQVVRALEKLE